MLSVQHHIGIMVLMLTYHQASSTFSVLLHIGIMAQALIYHQVNLIYWVQKILKLTILHKILSLVLTCVKNKRLLQLLLHLRIQENNLWLELLKAFRNKLEILSFLLNKSIQCLNIENWVLPHIGIMAQVLTYHLVNLIYWAQGQKIKIRKNTILLYFLKITCWVHQQVMLLEQLTVWLSSLNRMFWSQKVVKEFRKIFSSFLAVTQ